MLEKYVSYIIETTDHFYMDKKEKPGHSSGSGH